MSLCVDEFKYVPGENDAEYVKLLKEALERQKAITSKAVARVKELAGESPMINADRIRGMTVDGLARFLWEIAYHCHYEICDTGCPIADVCCCGSLAKTTEWLKAPAKESDLYKDHEARIQEAREKNRNTVVMAYRNPPKVES